MELFKKGRECSLQTPEQMLIILGDGRDVLSNGVTHIKKVNINNFKKFKYYFLVS